MEKKDLKDGEIYSGINPFNHLILFKFKQSKNTDDAHFGIGHSIFISTITGYLTLDCIHNVIRNLQEATLEQKHWLNECVRLNKFVSYDEAMSTFVKEFVLPKRWQIEHSKETLDWIKKNAEMNGEYINMKPYYNFPCDKHKNNSNSKLLSDYTLITFEQFKQHVLKENKLPYKILKQEAGKILQVQNEEGSIFDIGDYVKSLNSQQKGKITSFRFSVDKSKIIALTEFQKTGISIDKIEHHIEPKVEEEFVLPKTWWVQSSNQEELDIIKKYASSVISTQPFTNSINVTFGYFKPIYGNKIRYMWSLTDESKTNNTQITFDQFKKYVLKEVDKKEVLQFPMLEPKNVKLPVVGEVEESLLDKAKRLYPIGTKFKSPQNSNIYIVKGNHRYGTLVENSILSKIEEDGKFGYDKYEFLYYNNRWAEIIEQPKATDYKIFSFEHIGSNLFGHIQLDDKYSNANMCTRLEGHCTVQEMLSLNYKIHSVKQLSTGTIFTVGDRVRIVRAPHYGNSFINYEESNIITIKLSENNNIVFTLTGNDTVMIQNCTKP